MTPTSPLPGELLRPLHEALRQGTGSAAALAVRLPDGRRLAGEAGRTARVREVVADDLRVEQPYPGTPIGPATRFDLASLTKPMCTLTLLAQELSRPAPRLSLDDRLEQHLAEARGTVLGGARLGTLVSHTSGAPAWLDFFAATTHCRDELPYGVQGSRCRAVMARVLDTPLAQVPDTAAVYSDLGYMALGWLLEALHRAPLDDVFARDVAAPLGIQVGYLRLSRQPGRAVDVVATEIWPPRCAEGKPLQGAVHDDNCAALDGVAGHAGLFGSARDVLAWADAWLAAVQATGAAPHGPLALRPEVARWLATTPGVPGTSWRHGWDTPTQPGSNAGDLAPADTFGHLGFTGTSVWLSPGRGVVTVLLANPVHPARGDKPGIRALRRGAQDAVWRLTGP